MTNYIGRFAPSPTGPLHFGSLVAAVASYLDAKAHQGTWLLRMEDLDPPREQAGAADRILQSLEAHGLHWDQQLVYQSHRLEAYQQAMATLKYAIYPCNCIRQRIIGMQGRYDGHCRRHSPSASEAVAIRVMTDTLSKPQQHQSEHFDDIFLGPQYSPLDHNGDFIIKRKDGLFAYQLAVCVDDAYQGVTHVIRGHDLLDSTSRQRYLLSLFKAKLPEYGHTPLALGKDGSKLSKQAKARPLEDTQAASNIMAALHFLGCPSLPVDINSTSCEELLSWGVQVWSRQSVPTVASIAPYLRDK
ncbi:MAG: tRNA glutamyl-Q(34) synthetase GluQRS [Pseudomonadota bacterium]